MCHRFIFYSGVSARYYKASFLKYSLDVMIVEKWLNPYRIIAGVFIRESGLCVFLIKQDLIPLMSN